MKRLIHELRRVPGSAPVGPDEEADWLAAVAAGDPDAFARVVLAHGPLVLAACRRVLRNASDADDAFQAAFVVLLRRARSVRPPLAPWLYAVAVRTALAMRAADARRHRLHERYAREPRPEAEAPDATPDTDLRADIDRELAWLPTRERLAIVACVLEGLPRAEAAARLGWAPGTLDSRLARGRQRLARRLARLGYSTAVVAATAADLTARPAVPPDLCDAVRHLVTGRPPSEAVLKLSFLGEKPVARSYLALGSAVAVTAVTAVLGFGWSDPPPAPPAPRVPVAAPAPANPPAVAYELVCHWRAWVDDRGPKGELIGGHAVDRYKLVRPGSEKAEDVEAKALAVPPARGPLSPDGKRRVRSENYRDGASAVYYSHLILTDPAGQKLADVTPGGRRRDELPVWSADGKSILFVRERERGKRDTQALFRIDPDGKNLTSLSGRDVWAHAALSDGSVVALVTATPAAGNPPDPQKREVVVLRGGKEEKWAVQSDVLAIASDPAGKQLAYTRPKGVFGVLDLTTNTSVEVDRKGQLGSAATMYAPLWRPDGRAVAVRFAWPDAADKPVGSTIDQHVGVFEWDGKAWSSKVYKVGGDAEPFAWQAVRREARPAPQPALYTDDEAKALTEAAERAVPRGESKPKRDVFPALKLDPTRFRDRRVDSVGKVHLETWQLSPGYDITWMAHAVFDETPLDSDDKRIYAVRVVPRKVGP